jgi:hypothetical protein
MGSGRSQETGVTTYDAGDVRTPRTVGYKGRPYQAPCIAL